MNTPIRDSLRPAAAVCLIASILLAAGGCQSLDRQRSRSKAQIVKAQVSPESVGKAPAISAPDRTGGDSLTRAQSLQLQGQLTEALAEFEKAIESNPKLTTAYMGAGDIYRQQGDYDTAQKRYGQASSLEPRNFNANYMNGLMLQLLNRLSESVRAYLQALSIKPEDFNANLNLGTAYLQLNEPAEGLPYAQRAVQLNGKDAAARTNLGATFAALGRHEEAVVEYQQAAELTELSAPLLLNLAESLGKTQRYGEMINTLQQLVKTEPTAVAYERLGFGQFRQRQYPDALASFRKALEIDPNHYPALNGVGVCLLNQWKFSNETDEAARVEAVRALRRSVQLDGSQTKILELLGRYGK
jgi:tetratricopeptide (TPR) repeat protein